jgi:hypothetical protein
VTNVKVLRRNKLKKRILSIAVVLIAIVSTLIFSIPAFAHDGDADAHVDPNLVIVTENPNGTVTVSGTIETEAEAEAHRSGHTSYTETETSGWYSVNGVITVIGTNSNSDSGSYPSSDSTYDYTWSKTLTLPGDYSVRQGGTAYAEWSNAHDSDDDYDSHQSALAIFKIKPKLPTNLPQNEDGWYSDGAFGLRVGSSVTAVKWTGKDTLPAIEQMGSLSGFTLKVVFVAGTTISPEGKLSKFSVYKLPDGRLIFGPDTSMTVQFSNPVTVYELQSGKWVQIAQFTKLVNGQIPASPLVLVAP